MVETRKEINDRISKPTGHSKLDRDRHIAWLVLQLQKDVGQIKTANKDIIEDLRYLKGFAKVRGATRCLNALEESSADALNLLEHDCEKILNLTKKKKETVYSESRLANEEKKKARFEEGKARSIAMAKERASAKPSSKAKASDAAPKRKTRASSSPKTSQVNVKEIIKRRSPNASRMPKAAAVARFRQQPKRAVTEVVATSTDITLKFKDGRERTLPAPSQDSAFYTLREIILYLKPFDGLGLKKIVTQLHADGRVLFKATSFLDRFAKFRKNAKDLPDEDDFGGNPGRPPIKSLDSVNEFNLTELMNTSFVGDGYDDARDGLVSARKRRADSLGFSDLSCLEPSVSAIMNYNAAATIFDPDISEVNKESGRAKSISREVASRSVRSLACNLAATIISGFTPGSWDDKPADLPEGAELAYLSACDAFGTPMKPIEFEQMLNSDDTGRFVSEGEKQAKPTKKKKTGKTSKHSTGRSTRGTSSLWRRATAEDAICNGLKAKFKVLASSAGHLAPICIHFYGLSESELSVPFKVLKVKGLAVGADTKPGGDEYGYVLLSRGKANDDECDVSISEQVCEWYHKNIVLPFIEDIRKSKDGTTFTSDDCHVDDSLRSIFKLDSELTYLNFLRRPEVSEENISCNIQIVKVGAASTESYQALDCGKMFIMLSETNDELTSKYETSGLKTEITNLLADCIELTMRNGAKKRAMIDCVSIAPASYQKSFTKNSIRDGFVTTGEISKSNDGKSYICCPNVENMMRQCKTTRTWTTEKKAWFYSTIVPCVREMLRQGYINEQFFDDNGFPMDTDMDGNKMSRDHSLDQIHLQTTTCHLIQVLNVSLENGMVVMARSEVLGLRVELLTL